jgi:hypothetical protein
MKIKELKDKLIGYDDNDDVRFEPSRYSDDMDQFDIWTAQSDAEKFILSGGLIIYED